MRHQNLDEGSVNQSRRRFLKRSAVVGAAAAAGAGGHFLEDVIPSTSAGQNPSYLTPSYLPPGYKLIAKAESAVNEAGYGWAEHVEWFAAPTSERFPLAIYQSPRPRASWLISLQLDGGIPLQLQLPSGKGLPVKYIEGSMIRRSPTERVWDATNYHALTFSVGDLAVVVRGSRRGGIGQDDLEHIAMSMAVSTSTLENESVG